MSSVVFAGTPSFAVPSLKALAGDPAFEVVLVITQPDKPVGKKKTITPPPVKVEAEKLGIPVWQPRSFNRELATLHSKLATRPDYLIVVAYGQILSQEVLSWPTIYPINVHASLLPRWRGASPVQHAILAGDSETGVTIQVMARELDVGPVLAREGIPIAPDDTAETLMGKLSTLGADLLVKTFTSKLQPQPQSPTGITLCRKLSRQDGVADPASMRAEEIERRVRALHPWPGVTMVLDGTSTKIIRSSLSASASSHPLPCKDGTTLHLLDVQPPGKKPMTGAAWARGRRNR